jgi:malonyl-CoA O-methyltransferase
MSIQQAYNEWSDSYDIDKNLTRDLDQKVTREMLVNLHFGSILELGCGTGKNTSFYSQIGKKVHAVDLSEGMIEKAKEKVKSANVYFSIMDMTKKWTLDDRTYDLIVCNLVLEHIEDLSFIFSEAARVLQNNGRFFINELHPFRQYSGKKARYQKDGEEIEVDAFLHHISEFLQAATNSGLSLIKLNEYWHEEDQNKPPRIVSFLFEKVH